MTGFVETFGLTFVATVLLITGGAHLLGLAGFGRLLRAQGLLPGPAVLPVAVLVMLAELGLGLATLTRAGGLSSLALFATSALLGAVFLAYLRRLMATGHTGSCGCTPLASSLTPASLLPAGSLLVVGSVGGLVSWAANGTGASMPQTWSALAAAWGLALAALVLLLPASAPGSAPVRRRSPISRTSTLETTS